MSCRKTENLKVLQRVRNGATVYIGDNPIARKMRLRLVHPKAIPGSRPGTVGISEDAREPATTTVIADGMRNTERGPGEADSAMLANDAGAHTVNPLSNSSTSSVFVKMMRYTPHRPMLAKSLLDGILHVRKSMSKDQQGVWKMDDTAGDRLLAVFDELHVDIEKWREMETVPEESESAAASLVGDESADSQSLQHVPEAELPSSEPEVQHFILARVQPVLVLHCTCLKI